jgi:hypothetical protein
MHESLYPIEGDIPFLRAIGAFQMNLSHGISRKMFASRSLIVKFFEKSFGKWSHQLIPSRKCGLLAQIEYYFMQERQYRKYNALWARQKNTSPFTGKVILR